MSRLVKFILNWGVFSVIGFPFIMKEMRSFSQAALIYFYIKPKISNNLLPDGVIFYSKSFQKRPFHHVL